MPIPTGGGGLKSYGRRNCVAKSSANENVWFLNKFKCLKSTQFCRQLAKETWFDLLTFVPRGQLGQIVPEIGDRRFAGIVQPFLHNYREITLGNIRIDRPRPKKEDASGRLDLRAWPKSTEWYHQGGHENLVLPDMEMPINIKDFLMIRLRFAPHEI
jgi:hypothetical protein